MVIDTLQPVISTQNLLFAEFFAGIGLVRKGLEQEGSWQCAFANDIDKFKADIYTRNFGKDDFLLDDIANIYANSIPDVALVTASFPCQDLSLAGNRKGLTGNRSGTFFEFIRIITIFAANSKTLSISTASFDNSFTKRIKVLIWAFLSVRSPLIAVGSQYGSKAPNLLRTYSRTVRLRYPLGSVVEV